MILIVECHPKIHSPSVEKVLIDDVRADLASLNFHVTIAGLGRRQGKAAATRASYSLISREQFIERLLASVTSKRDGKYS
jgi:hypothetical protein